MLSKKSSPHHKLLKAKKRYIYATEADILNVALFGLTAKDWKKKHVSKKGNIRDYANVEQLICLSNLESLNAILIKEGLDQSPRLKKLNQTAISQMKSLVGNGISKKWMTKKD